MSLAEAQILMIEKDQENAALKRVMAFKAELVERGGFKYRKDDQGEPTGYPFCLRCEEKEGKFYQLTSSYEPGQPQTCPNCHAEFAEYIDNVTAYS
jgi:hypothetical protein